MAKIDPEEAHQNSELSEFFASLLRSRHACHPCPGGEQEDSEGEDHGSVASEQNRANTSADSDEAVDNSNYFDKEMSDEEIKKVWIHHHYMDGGWYKIDSILWELMERQYNHHPSIFNDYFTTWWVDRWEHLDSATCRANLWPIFAVSTRVDFNYEVRQVLADCEYNLGIAQARQLFRDGERINSIKIIDNLDHAVLSITYLNSIFGAMQTAIADGIRLSRDIITCIEQLLLDNRTTNAHMTEQMMNMNSLLHEIYTQKPTMEPNPREGSLNLRMEASGMPQFDLETKTASSYLPSSDGSGAFGPKMLTKVKKLETQTRARIQEGSKSIVDQRSTGLHFEPEIRHKGQEADKKKHGPGKQNQKDEPPFRGYRGIIPNRPHSHDLLPKGRGISKVPYKPFPEGYSRRVPSITDDVGNVSKSFLGIMRGTDKISLSEKPSRKVSFTGKDDWVEGAFKPVQAGGEELLYVTGYQYDHDCLPADKPEPPIPTPAARHHRKPLKIDILLSSMDIAKHKPEVEEF